MKVTECKEISDAIMRTAFSAQQAGTDFDTLSAYVTTVSEKTRRSAETIGESFKSIYSRYYNIKLGNVDEDGKTINDTETAMNRLGISIRSSKGEFKDFDVVLEEFVQKYKEGQLSQVDFMAGVNALGGTRQKETLLALIENFDKVKEHMGDISNATGSAKEMYGVYADSVQAKINDMKRAFENLYEKIMSSDTLKYLITEATEFVSALSNIDGSTVKLIATFTALGLALNSVAKFSIALKGVESIALLGREAGLIGSLVGWFGRLGTAISGIATASLAFIATPLGATLAGLTLLVGGSIAYYEEYKDLMSKPIATTPTEDLNAFEQTINSLNGSVYKSKQELQKAKLVYEDFGEGISDSFKEGIEKATENYHNFEMELVGANSSDKITDATSAKIKSSIDAIVNDAKNTVMSRKSEVQNELSKMFTLGDNKIDLDEQGVLNSIGDEANAQFDKIAEIHEKVYDVWNKAIAYHGKLSQEDIQQIQDYVAQIEQIKAEAEAKNKAESSFALNQFGARLEGISAKDAGDEYKKASDELSKNFANEKATYQTGIDDLNKAIEKAQANGETEKVESYRKQVESKTKEIQDIDKKEYSQRRQYLDMLYKKNPTLQNELNEEDGTLFNGADKNAQGRKEKLRSEFAELANVTETGIQHIQDANGKWHDIYVTFDKATGNITGAYDTFTGEFGGYSEKLENEIKTAGSKMKLQMEELQKSLMVNGGGIKIDADNNAINATTDQLITRLDSVIQKADGTKTAIQNINGTKIRLEFDKDGALVNALDVQDAINGKFADNPAVVKTKIEVDGKSLSTVDSAIKKLEDLPEDKKVKIDINGEEAIMTAEQAEQKINELPKDKDIDIVVNTEEADSNIDTTSKKVEDVDGKTATVQVNENGAEESTQAVNETGEKVDSTNGKSATVTVNADTSQAMSAIQSVLSKLGSIAGKTFSAVVNATKSVAEVGLNAKAEAEVKEHNATGTNNAKAGYSEVAEDGFEIVIGRQVKKLNGGETILNNKTSNEFIKALNTSSSQGETTETINISVPKLNSAKKKGVQVPADNDGGYFPSLQGGGSSSSSSSSSSKKAESEAKKAEGEATKAEKFRKQIERMHSEIDIDPYYQENNAIKDLDNALNTNKTTMEGLKEGTKEYQNAQLKEIELYEKKRGALVELNMAQQTEADTIKEKLSKYSFLFDANGKLLNSESRLLELEKSINEEQGNTEEEKQKKQDDINWLKDINELVKKYGTLTRDTIPKTIDEYNDLANTIQKVKDEMQKFNEETLSSFRDTLAGYIKEEYEKEAEDAKEKLSTAKESKLKALEEEKQAEIDSYDAEIKSLQDELESLNDETTDNVTKLNKLKAERDLWKKDDSVFAKSKITDLDTQISSLEKTIKKDSIQKQIDNLNDEKQSASDDYDEKISDLNDYYDKKEKALEKSNKESLSEEKAYAKADELIKSNSQDEIIKLMEKYGESYKNVGSILGKNFKEGWIEQIEQAKTAYDSLMNLAGTSSSSSSSDNSTSTKFENSLSTGVTYSGGSTGAISVERPLTEAEEQEMYKKLARYDTGGRVPNNLSSSGGIAIVDAGEKILNKDDSVILDEIYSYFKDLSSNGLLSQLSQGYSNIGNYIIPTGTELSNLSSNIVNTNSNTDNSITQPISMPVTIINEKGAESFTEQKLFKAMNKWQKEQGRLYR